MCTNITKQKHMTIIMNNMIFYCKCPDSLKDVKYITNSTCFGTYKKLASVFRCFPCTTLFWPIHRKALFYT